MYTHLLISLLLLICAGVAEAQSAKPGLEYRHSAERSSFAIGDGAASRSGEGFAVVEGKSGSFYTNTNTGATLSVPTAKEELPVPFSSEEQVHSNYALEYMRQAGIPMDEVSGTHVTTTMMAGGPDYERIDTTKAQLLYFTTHLERSLGGVRVEGSLAFVAFDAAEKIITEGVFWPKVSADVVAEAEALQKLVADATTRERYLGMVRSVGPELTAIESGEVRIVHTSGMNAGPFVARAVYVVLHRPAPEGKYVEKFFDITGQLVRVEDYRPQTPQRAPRR